MCYVVDLLLSKLLFQENVFPFPFKTEPPISVIFFKNPKIMPTRNYILIINYYLLIRQPPLTPTPLLPNPLEKHTFLPNMLLTIGRKRNNSKRFWEPKEKFIFIHVVLNFFFHFKKITIKNIKRWPILGKILHTTMRLLCDIVTILSTNLLFDS